MRARLAKPDDELAKAVLSASGGRCGCTVGAWGDPHAGRCKRAHEAVYIDDAGQYLVMCKECRIMAFGLTSAEKLKRTRHNKAAQSALFDSEQIKPHRND